MIDRPERARMTAIPAASISKHRRTENGTIRSSPESCRLPCQGCNFGTFHSSQYAIHFRFLVLETNPATLMIGIQWKVQAQLSSFANYEMGCTSIHQNSIKISREWMVGFHSRQRAFLSKSTCVRLSFPAGELRTFFHKHRCRRDDFRYHRNSTWYKVTTTFNTIQPWKQLCLEYSSLLYWWPPPPWGFMPSICNPWHSVEVQPPLVWAEDIQDFPTLSHLTIRATMTQS